jgi:alkane 1-monooxygenase
VKGLIAYRDRKRWLWTLSVLWPLMPLSGIGIYMLSGSEWAFAVPLLLAYVVSPVLDWLIGADPNNPPEEIVPQLEQDHYYRILTWLTVPLHFVVLALVVWFIAIHSLGPLAVIALAFTAGIYSGLCINTAHELGHKKSAFERLLARLALAVPAYGHFGVEHNRGHHRLVATPEDPASARMGESLYRFMLREIPGAARRAWRLETGRLHASGHGFFNRRNEILQSYAVTLVFQGGLVFFGGWTVLPFLLLHNFWAWFQLTCANYVEHYGLLREKGADGNYLPCRPRHSWNCNYVFSNLVMFHLERHSDHHAYPARRYQALRNHDGIPQLPTGYFGMYLAAYVPWLWYRVMDQRLLRLPHIRGDFAKINIDPERSRNIRRQVT